MTALRQECIVSGERFFSGLYNYSVRCECAFVSSGSCWASQTRFNPRSCWRCNWQRSLWEERGDKDRPSPSLHWNESSCNVTRFSILIGEAAEWACLVCDSLKTLSSFWRIKKRRRVSWGCCVESVISIQRLPQNNVWKNFACAQRIKLANSSAETWKDNAHILCCDFTVPERMHSGVRWYHMQFFLAPTATLW